MKDCYVDGETGKDSNPGTVDKPMKTISVAAAKIDEEREDDNEATNSDRDRAGMEGLV